MHHPIARILAVPVAWLPAAALQAQTFVVDQDDRGGNACAFVEGSGSPDVVCDTYAAATPFADVQEQLQAADGGPNDGVAVAVLDTQSRFLNYDPGTGRLGGMAMRTLNLGRVVVWSTSRGLVSSADLMTMAGRVEGLLPGQTMTFLLRGVAVASPGQQAQVSYHGPNLNLTFQDGGFARVIQVDQNGDIQLVGHTSVLTDDSGPLDVQAGAFIAAILVRCPDCAGADLGDVGRRTARLSIPRELRPAGGADPDWGRLAERARRWLQDALPDPAAGD